MWSVYIIKSNKFDWYYVGMSKDPSDRLTFHNSGKVRSTKARRPYSILIIEDFDGKISARRREKYYKTGFGKKVWMKKINNGPGFPARSPAGHQNHEAGWRLAGGPAGNP